MKRIYFTTAAVALAVLLNGQAFWTSTSFRGAFPQTDNTPATDWTHGWTDFDPENTSYPAPTATVSSDITSGTTWSGVILLQNKVFVKNNAVLTISPGTVIRGDKTSQGSLIITRGAKIVAQGTDSSPIVFTSNEDPGNRAEGDWGGVVILGKALNNQPGGVANIEGIAPTADTEFGGTDDNDNSGHLSYVRIEFAGIPLQPNKEINGLTFGSVGAGTTVHHIQVSFCGDDAFEWFGGTVDATHLVSYRNLDDDFDTDFGYRGRVQFGLIIRDPFLSDAAGDSNAWESDNDATGSAALPLTKAVFSNITVIGPKGNGTVSLPTGEKFEKSFRIRRNSSISVFNSVTTGWEKGLSVEGTASESNFTSGNAMFAHNIMAGYGAGSTIVTASHSFYNGFFGLNGNDSLTSVSQISWVNAFPVLGIKPDLRLNPGSAAATGAAFPSSVFGNEFVSVNEQTNHDFRMFPNPADGLFLLEADAPGAGTLMIRDISGTLIHVQGTDQLTSRNYISTKTLADGIYFVELHQPGSVTVKKLLVRH